MKNLLVLLKISAVLWFIWGVVHMFAGIMTMYFVLSGDISAAIGGIADAVDPATLQMDYPAAAGAILGQHGFNLLWIGTVTLICSFFIWRKNKNAIFLAALVGGLADVGYFLFMDLGGYVNFVPGTVMTLVSASAIILSFYAYFRSDKLQNI
jgi:heme/copper-type cytochrome/quinol oxidase subunit 3